MPRTYFFYLMASRSRCLYAGVTNDLMRRVREHRDGARPDAFTATYRVRRLVYYERFDYVNDARTRERQVKSWRRVKKLRLIASVNPAWRDLALDWTSGG